MLAQHLLATVKRHHCRTSANLFSASHRDPAIVNVSATGCLDQVLVLALRSRRCVRAIRCGRSSSTSGSGGGSACISSSIVLLRVRACSSRCTIRHCT
jgi:hypothetical protein